MKNLRLSLIVLLSTVVIFGGCASWNRTQKGAAVGTAAGGASAVSGYLVSRDIDASRLTVKGFDENLPKYENETADGLTQNRRVESLITANEKMKAEAGTPLIVHIQL